MAPPWHAIFVCDEDATWSSSGWVIVTFAELVHPFASVVVTVWVPAESPVPVACVPPRGDHE